MGYRPASEIKASGGSQPHNQEGASHLARHGRNDEALLMYCMHESFIQGPLALSPRAAILLIATAPNAMIDPSPPSD